MKLFRCSILYGMLLLSLITACRTHHRISMEYADMNGGKIKLYSWYHGHKSYSGFKGRVQVSLVNYARRYEIICDIKDGDGPLWLSQAGFLKEKEISTACEYEAITDTSNNIFTTSCHLQYSRDSLAAAPRIYLTDLEKDLLAIAIKQRMAAGPETAGYYNNPIDPHSILFFVCVPLPLNH